MVTDEDSIYYGDFICSYKSWQKVKDKYMLTGIGIAGQNASFPTAIVIEKAPSVYITGASGENKSGFIYAGRVAKPTGIMTVWQEAMNFKTVSDPGQCGCHHRGFEP